MTRLKSEIFAAITLLVARDGTMVLSNFGTWHLKRKGSRVGFNIKAHHAMPIKSRTVIRFVPSRNLKRKVNQISE